MKYQLSAFALAALLGSGVAAAADAPKGEFANLDADSDGAITRGEAQAKNALAEKFDLYDANHDGVLSLREYEAAVAGSKSTSNKAGR